MKEKDAFREKILRTAAASLEYYSRKLAMEVSTEGMGEMQQALLASAQRNLDQALQRLNTLLTLLGTLK